MKASAASHIPVLSLPTFKTFDDLDGVLADVIDIDGKPDPHPSEEEQRLAEFRRGVAEGEARTKAHSEALREQERDRHAQQVEDERVRFEMRESANINAAIEGFLQITEQRLSYSLSKLLMPFLKQQIVEQLVDAFVVRLRQLAEAPEAYKIRLRGPETLVARVMDQLPDMRDRIETQSSDQVELQAQFDETTIETRLGDWLGQLDSLQKNGTD